MSTILWQNSVIDPKVSGQSPGMISTCELISQSRNGSSQTYTIKISIRTDNDLGFWNGKWFCKVKVGGKSFSDYLEIKPYTGSTVIGKTVYSKQITGTITISGDTGTAPISVEYWEQYTSSKQIYYATKTATLSYNPMPTITLSLTDQDDTSATFSYTYQNIEPEHIAVYIDGVLYQNITSSPFTITGLLPSTSYNIKANGYANGGYGSDSNVISLTTYPTPVFITGISVSDIQPFQFKVTLNVSDITNLKAVDYILLDEDDEQVQTLLGTMSTSWTPVGLTEETIYKVKARVQTKYSDAWSDYVYTQEITTTSDQASAYVKSNSSWIKGKTYKKENGAWLVGKKVYVKDTTWNVGVNN